MQLRKFCVITFAIPVSLAEAQEVVKQTGMTVLSYGSSGRDISNQLSFAYSFPQSGMIAGLPDVQGIQIDGIMVLTGIVEHAADNLEFIADNPRLALVDVIYNTISQDVETALGYPVELDQVGITTPAWYIAAGEIRP
ncbi:MAG TPA: hypothetical protein VJG32_00625 [Anaerolineae bacterium]|nr:hypothetical protein [Anaerolineae bacterium]